MSFPPHLVRQYFHRFELGPDQTVLDPFCGTGTTVVEAKLNRISGIGIEANPVAHFASYTKTNWSIDPDNLVKQAQSIAQAVTEHKEFYEPPALRTLPDTAVKLLPANAISPLPLHKALVLLEQINASLEGTLADHARLAFAKAIVLSCSNLRFRPEVGIRPQKREDAPVVESWLDEIYTMAEDLTYVKTASGPAARIHLGDARNLRQHLEPQSIDCVFTSPPYPNEKDYTRATRLESVLLGFIQSKEDLRYLKERLLRSNTRNVYRDDDDDQWVKQHPKIQEIASNIENRRLELGKTSGFEKKYGRVTQLYFGGMARHFLALQPFLKPGAWLGYVVGDQASFFQVLIPTGQILAEIAASVGYEVVSLDLFRTRLASVTQQQMREEVVVLRWPG
ncbi:DNA methyltransferase [Pseudanabaena sp. FACHB-2040]|uniref:DNA methyltransferase n=1 Tax=Pseudanabaena sp. FACHB-2040 TaxID=2692859 RepID=UPI001F5529F9|nr:DNA methyltransferase [Pseudanabaena sp. FACHB-2040]